MSEFEPPAVTEAELPAVSEFEPPAVSEAEPKFFLQLFRIHSEGKKLK